MPEMLTIRLAQRIAGIRVLNVSGEARSGAASMGGDNEQATAERIEMAIQAERASLAAELDQQKDRFAQLCRAAGAAADNLDKLYRETLADNRADIAKLAVEIARRILKHQVAQGNYDIRAIVEEALKHAPTRQNIVIRLNPEDLPGCQQHQQENPDSPFAELEFAADWNVGRGECLVETPRGIVKSFIEEHLERISHALQKVE